MATAVSGPSAVSLLDDRWDRLAADQSVPNPCLTPTWLRALHEHEEGEPLLVIVERAGELVGAGAFGVYRPAGRLGPRLARWLGDPRLWFSPDVLAAPGVDGAAAEVVGAALRHVDALLLPVIAESRADAGITERVPWRGRADVMGEGWLAHLPPPSLVQLRDRVAKETRKASTTLETKVSSAPDDVAAALDRMFVLHRARWHGRPEEIPVFSATDRYRSWHRRVAVALASEGRTRIVEVIEEGDLIASQLAYVLPPAALWWAGTSRRDARVRSPGHAAILALVEMAVAEGLTMLDLGLGANEPGGPKARLDPQARRFHRVVAGDSRVVQRKVTLLLAARDLARRVRHTNGRGVTHTLAARNAVDAGS